VRGLRRLRREVDLPLGRPVETEFGRKTTIRQGSCNSDLSCLRGDCPSFVMVTPAATGGRTEARPLPHLPVALVEPQTVRTPSELLVRMPGIGGPAWSPSLASCKWPPTSTASTPQASIRPDWPKRAARWSPTCASGLIRSTVPSRPGPVRWTCCSGSTCSVPPARRTWRLVTPSARWGGQHGGGGHHGHGARPFHRLPPRPRPRPARHSGGGQLLPRRAVDRRAALRRSHADQRAHAGRRLPARLLAGHRPFPGRGHHPQWQRHRTEPPRLRLGRAAVLDADAVHSALTPAAPPPPLLPHRSAA